MKVVLKKMLEKLVIVVLCLVLIIGNILLIYNVRNKFVDIKEKFDIIEIIDKAKYISVKNIENNQTIEIDNDEKKDDLKNIFNKIKIRKSKLKLMDKNQKIDYTVFIVEQGGNDFYINFADGEIMLYDEIYESDFNAKSYFEDMFIQN